MLCSVVTPVLNGARTIRRTLDSLSVQRGDFEHIVVDAGSTDGTVDIVKSYEGRYPVRLVQKKDRSLYEGVWNGMQETRGEILSYINADDLYMPWTLATVRSVMERHSEIQWLAGMPSWMDEDTGVATTCGYAPVYFRRFFQKGWYSSAKLGFVQQESMFWRRSLWEQSDPRELLVSNRFAGDFLLWRRFSERADLHTVAAVLACFVLSKQQVSRVNMAKYLAECGITGTSHAAPAWGRGVHRLLSACFFRRVVLPHRELSIGAAG